MNPDLFRQELAKMDIILSEKQMEQFNNYYQLLIEWNNKINLTAITKLNEVYLKHFYDSIVLIEAMPKEKKDLLLCDVGSGAGFPSIPLKIVYPELKISIVDSLNKRIKFLDMLCNNLGLNDVSLYHERAEIFGQDSKNRESFDVVTARAVARLNVLSELCLPLVKKDGYFLALKAAQSEIEMIESKKAIATLGGKMEKELAYNLPFSNDKRYIIKIQKKKETPNKYPRKPGIPNKKPLI